MENGTFALQCPPSMGITRIEESHANTLYLSLSISLFLSISLSPSLQHMLHSNICLKYAIKFNVSLYNIWRDREKERERRETGGDRYM